MTPKTQKRTNLSRGWVSPGSGPTTNVDDADADAAAVVDETAADSSFTMICDLRM